jgi:signal transduction histidine kinase
MSSNFLTPREPSREVDHPLARAFASFTEAAGSLERTYGQLQAQVTHLRQELEITNRDLASSLDENHRIRERLRRILEGLPCGVLVLEADKRISTLNPEAVRLLGGEFASVTALPAEVGATLEIARQEGGEAELEIAAGKSVVEPVWVAFRHAWLERSIAHETSVFILRDVSAERRLEQEREQLRRQQALVEMSALLAHEIRNPLGSLELFAGLLADANLQDENRRWIEHMQAGLRTLSATVNNVLHLNNAVLPELVPIDVGQLLDWAYNFLLPMAKQARVELQVINGLEGVTIAANRHRLEQVLLNLGINAFRFMPSGGWVSIHGRPLQGAVEDAASIEIVVRDTGPGITPDDLPRIFEAGFSTRPGSSGLGLAVCRRILEQHGGSITVESKIGEGTLFSLRIPRRERSEEVAAADAMPKLTNVVKKCSVGDPGMAAAEARA